MNGVPKILVVDDLAANRLAIRTALRGVEATIVEASNGFDALAITLEEEFALILLDVQMPEMDGFEVCERLSANPQTADTPVIFITAAHNSPEDRIHGYRTGATDYLTKPIDRPNTSTVDSRRPSTSSTFPTPKPSGNDPAAAIVNMCATCSFVKPRTVTAKSLKNRIALCVQNIVPAQIANSNNKFVYPVKMNGNACTNMPNLTTLLPVNVVRRTYI